MAGGCGAQGRSVIPSGKAHTYTLTPLPTRVRFLRRAACGPRQTRPQGTDMTGLATRHDDLTTPTFGARTGCPHHPPSPATSPPPTDTPTTMRLRTPLALLHRAQLTRASTPLHPSAIPALVKQLTPSLRRHLSSEIPSTLPPFEKPFYITTPIFYVNSGPLNCLSYSFG